MKEFIGFIDKTQFIGTGSSSVSALFARALTHRIDIAGMGDSGQLLSGHGWDEGFQWAGDQLGYPMYSLPLLAQNENNGNGSGKGYLANRAGSGAVGATTGAPAALAKYMDQGVGSLFPDRYTYVTSNVGSNTLIGLVLAANCPINNGGPLVCYIWWGSFDTGSGVFRPFARLGQSPFTTLADPGVINTNTGEISLHRAQMSIAADPTRSDKPIEFKPLRTGVQGITAPYFNTYMRVVNPDKLVGFGYHTLNYHGGGSAYDNAFDLLSASDDTLGFFFGELRRLQDEEKTIILTFHDNLNDPNETSQPSLGPGAYTDPTSPEFFVDNHVASLNRIKEIFDANDFDYMNEVHKVFLPAHATSDPDNAIKIANRDALKEFAANEPNAHVVDFPSMISFAEMVSNGWINNAGADPPHLTQTGYRQMSLLAMTS